MVISFQRQLNDDGSTNAITQEYDLYADIDEYDQIDREGRAEEGKICTTNFSFRQIISHTLYFFTI